MGKPHKHAELIKAWADGAEIEVLCPFGTWELIENPAWFDDEEFRIARPSKVRYFKADYKKALNATSRTANLKITFDGETGELKSAEVLHA